MKSLICFCMALIVATSGCGVSLFVKPEEQAVVDEHVFSNKSLIPGWILAREGVRALSTKLERRLIIFDRKKEKGKKWKLSVCAEPPAEAIQALESVSKLEAELKKTVRREPIVYAEGNRRLRSDDRGSIRLPTDTGVTVLPRWRVPMVPSLPERDH